MLNILRLKDASPPDKRCCAALGSGSACADFMERACGCCFEVAVSRGAPVLLRALHAPRAGDTVGDDVGDRVGDDGAGARAAGESDGAVGPRLVKARSRAVHRRRPRRGQRLQSRRAADAQCSGGFSHHSRDVCRCFDRSIAWPPGCSRAIRCYKFCVCLLSMPCGCAFSYGVWLDTSIRSHTRVWLLPSPLPRPPRWRPPRWS